MSRWYIIHAYSGFENKVRDAIVAEASRMGLDRLVPSAREPRSGPRRSVAQLVEHRSPKPRAGGSSPSTPASR